MKLYFDDAGFDGQLQRSVGKCDAGMANVGECLYIASRITAGDRDSWHAAWSAFADGLVDQAAAARPGGHVASAASLRVRAAEYYRQAFFCASRGSRRQGADDRLPGQRRRVPPCAALPAATRPRECRGRDTRLRVHAARRRPVPDDSPHRRLRQYRGGALRVGVSGPRSRLGVRRPRRSGAGQRALRRAHAERPTGTRDARDVRPPRRAAGSRCRAASCSWAARSAACSRSAARPANRNWPR